MSRVSSVLKNKAQDQTAPVTGMLKQLKNKKLGNRKKGRGNRC